MQLKLILASLLFFALSVSALPNIDYDANHFLQVNPATITRATLGYTYITNYRTNNLILFKYHMYQFRVLRNGQTNPMLWTYRAKDTNMLAFMDGNEWDTCRQTQTLVQCWGQLGQGVNDQIDSSVLNTAYQIYNVQQYVRNYQDLPTVP